MDSFLWRETSIYAHAHLALTGIVYEHFVLGEGGLRTGLEAQKTLVSAQLCPSLGWTKPSLLYLQIFGWCMQAFIFVTERCFRHLNTSFLFSLSVLPKVKSLTFGLDFPELS